MLHFCIDSKTSTNGYVSIHGLSAYKVQMSTIPPHTHKKEGWVVFSKYLTPASYFNWSVFILHGIGPFSIFYWVCRFAT